MATPTLILGNNDWAVKPTKLLGYYNRESYFLSREFTFARTTTGSQVGRTGLIRESAIDTPRIDFFNNSNGALLLEPSRTNNVTWSQEFNQAAWNKVICTITPDTDISPDGTQNADTLVADGNASLAMRRVRQTKGAAGPVTQSCFFKAGTYEIGGFLHSDNGTTYKLFYNLTTGAEHQVSGTWDDYGIEDHGNGWYRIWGTYTNVDGSLSHQFGTNEYTSVGGGETLLIWGAQIEYNEYHTSYIKTEAATVNRGVDDLSLTGLDTAGIIGSELTTIFTLNDCYQEATGSTLFFGFEGVSGNDAIGFNKTGVAGFHGYRFWLRQGGSTDYISGSNTEFPVKIGYSLSATNRSVARNGVIVYNDSTAYNGLLNQFKGLGSQALCLSPYMQFYNTALTDQELIDLTS